MIGCFITISKIEGGGLGQYLEINYVIIIQSKKLIGLENIIPVYVFEI